MLIAMVCWGCRNSCSSDTAYCGWYPAFTLTISNLKLLLKAEVAFALLDFSQIGDSDLTDFIAFDIS